MVAHDPFTGRMDLVGGQTSLGLVPVESAAAAPVQAAPRVPGPPGPGYFNVFGLSTCGGDAPRAGGGRAP